MIPISLKKKLARIEKLAVQNPGFFGRTSHNFPRFGVYNERFAPEFVLYARADFYSWFEDCLESPSAAIVGSEIRVGAAVMIQAFREMRNVDIAVNIRSLGAETQIFGGEIRFFLDRGGLVGCLHGDEDFRLCVPVSVSGRLRLECVWTLDDDTSYRHHISRNLKQA